MLAPLLLLPVANLGNVSQHCLKVLADTTCTQTPVQQLASAGDPLTTPLPLPELEIAIIEQDRDVIAAWSTYKSYGNFDLCMTETAAHYCNVHVVMSGPSLGLCLPQQCTISKFLERYECLSELTNLTAELSHLLFNVSSRLPNALVAGPLRYLAVNSTHVCSEQKVHRVEPGAIVVTTVISLLGAAVVASTLRTTLCVTHLGWAPPGEVAASFCALTNARGLLATRAGPKSKLAFLHGVRTLSTGWIILGHCFAFYSTQVLTSSRLLHCLLSSPRLTSPLRRPPTSSLRRPTISARSTPPSSSAPSPRWTPSSGCRVTAASRPRGCIPDSVAPVSHGLAGFLVACSMVRKLPAGGGVGQKLGTSAIALTHRFLRLTPVYMFMLLFYT